MVATTAFHFHRVSFPLRRPNLLSIWPVRVAATFERYRPEEKPPNYAPNRRHYWHAQRAGVEQQSFGVNAWVASPAAERVVDLAGIGL